MLLQRKQFGRTFLHMRVATIDNWTANHTQAVKDLIDMAPRSLSTLDKTLATPLTLFFREILRHNSACGDIEDPGAFMEVLSVLVRHTPPPDRLKALESVRFLPFLRAPRLALLQRLVVRQHQLEVLEKSRKACQDSGGGIPVYVLGDFVQRQYQAVSQDMITIFESLEKDLCRRIHIGEPAIE